ncbi:MAG TPA: P63C domain-containing protein [Bradyrhizobium sp.]|nr:P63C domain-containing protein [Bradyrhizobium sp.]
MTKSPDKVKAGLARKEALSPERRAEIAREAAITRWGNRPPSATHKGSFQEEFGVDVECYVLDDDNKTAVISQTGMGSALGMSARGNAFPRFLATRAMSGVVGAELREKLENPLKFQWGTGGAEAPPATIHGFDATLLIDVCKAVIDAESKGELHPRHANIARQAHIIVGASAKAGIKGLVYALAGYNPATEEVIAAFKLYVQAEAKKYEPEFPNELYLQWHRLYDIPVPERGKPWHFKYLTVRHIYHPLAKSSGKIYALLQAHKARGGNRAKKLFQFLNAIGARALRVHLGRVLEMAESSPDKQTYEKKIVERFGGQIELELVVPPPAEKDSAAAAAPDNFKPLH